MCIQSTETLSELQSRRQAEYAIYPWASRFDRNVRADKAAPSILAFQPGTVGGPKNPFTKIPVRSLVKVPAHYRLPSRLRTFEDRANSYVTRPNHPRVPVSVA